MPLPTFVTQENLRFDGTLTNCIVLSDDGTTKELIQWDHLSIKDQKRFIFLIDKFGGLTPLAAPIGASQTVDMGGSVVPGNLTGLDTSVSANAILGIGITNSNTGVTYTAVTAGVLGNSIRISHTDPLAINQTLSIVVTVNDIVVNLATDGVGIVTSTSLEIETAINADAFASALVTALKEGDGLGVIVPQVLINLSGGATAVVYGVTITVDGTTNVVSFEGNAAATFTDLLNTIDTQVTGELVAIDISGDIRVSSLTIGGSSSVSITNDTLFGALTGFVKIENAVQGALSTIDGMKNSIMDNGTDYFVTYKGMIEILQGKPLRAEKYTDLDIYFDGTDWRRKDTDAIVTI